MDQARDLPTSVCTACGRRNLPPHRPRHPPRSQRGPAPHVGEPGLSGADRAYAARRAKLKLLVCPLLTVVLPDFDWYPDADAVQVYVPGGTLEIV